MLPTENLTQKQTNKKYNPNNKLIWMNKYVESNLCQLLWCCKKGQEVVWGQKLADFFQENNTLLL